MAHVGRRDGRPDPKPGVRTVSDDPDDAPRRGGRRSARRVGDDPAGSSVSRFRGAVLPRARVGTSDADPAIPRAGVLACGLHGRRGCDRVSVSAPLCGRYRDQRGRNDGGRLFAAAGPAGADVRQHDAVHLYRRRRLVLSALQRRRDAASGLSRLEPRRCGVLHHQLPLRGRRHRHVLDQHERSALLHPERRLSAARRDRRHGTEADRRILHGNIVLRLREPRRSRLLGPAWPQWCAAAPFSLDRSHIAHPPDILDLHDGLCVRSGADRLDLRHDTQTRHQGAGGARGYGVPRFGADSYQPSHARHPTAAAAAQCHPRYGDHPHPREIAEPIRSGARPVEQHRAQKFR